jgi:hypothetical protein
VEGNVGATHLAWTAVCDAQFNVNKPYDLLYVDIPHYHPGFHLSLSDEWACAATVIDSHAVDRGSPGRPCVVRLGEGMRFYRAARTGKWENDRHPRIGSAEVYVAKCLNLEEGENWVSLFTIPDTNTLSYVFGTNRLPAGRFLSESTAIEWYGSTHNATATNLVWLDGLTHSWRSSSGANANNLSIPLSEGFNIIIPPGSNAQHMVLMGKLPERIDARYGHVHHLMPSGVYNVVSYNLPYRISLAESGLREAGFTGAPPGQEVNPNNSDEIRILRRGGGSLASPQTRILMNDQGQFVYWSGGSGSAENYRFDVDDAIILYTRRSSDTIHWTLTLPYPAPTTDFSP